MRSTNKQTNKQTHKHTNNKQSKPSTHKQKHQTSNTTPNQSNPAMSRWTLRSSGRGVAGSPWASQTWCRRAEKWTEHPYLLESLESQNTYIITCHCYHCLNLNLCYVSRFFAIFLSPPDPPSAQNQQRPAKWHIENLLGWQEPGIQAVGTAQDELVRDVRDFWKHLLWLEEMEWTCSTPIFPFYTWLDKTCLSLCRLFFHKDPCKQPSNTQDLPTVCRLKTKIIPFYSIKKLKKKKKTAFKNFLARPTVLQKCINSKSHLFLKSPLKAKSTSIRVSPAVLGFLSFLRRGRGLPAPQNGIGEALPELVELPEDAFAFGWKRAAVVKGSLDFDLFYKK